LKYEKFSSMGNGYTFELETLIFWGLCMGVCRELELEPSQVLVYGDDIVVPVAAYELLSEVLTFCGFTLNSKKSFGSGPFRESCGKDYFLGADVRPFFLKEIPYEIETLFRLCNGLRVLSARRALPFTGCELRFQRPWSTVVRAIPRSVRQHCQVPAHAGDSDGIKSNWDESQASSFVISNKDGWEGVSGIRYQSSPLEGPRCTNFLGGVASLLYRLSDGGKLMLRQADSTRESLIEWLAELSESSLVSPRQERGCTYRLRDGAFYGPWTDLGPWI
jgi:hypothetical protein